MEKAITIVRNKGMVKCFGEEARIAIDLAADAFNSFATEHKGEACAVAVKQAIAASLIREDKDAMKKAGFDKFGEACKALVGLNPSNASQYAKSGDFYRRPDAPAIKGWFSPSTLYLILAKDISDATINAAIESNALHDGMTFDEVKAWVESQVALTDGEAEVVPTYDFHFYFNGNESSASGITVEEAKVTMRSIMGILDSVTVEPDRYATFNPHVEIVNGKSKAKAKGLALMWNGGKVCTAVYAKHNTPAKKSAIDVKSLSREEKDALIAELMK